MSALVPIVSERDRRRIVAATGLLASDRDGEVVAAARAVCRILEPYGLTQAALVEKALEPPQRVFPSADIRGGDAPIINHRRVARQCLNATILTDWERGFLTSILEQRSLTDRQRERLRAIRGKICRSYGR